MKLNRIVIALVVVAFAIVFGFAYLLFNLDDSAAPTELSAAGNLGPIELPVAPAWVLAMDQPGDAAVLYRNAIGVYQQDPSVFDQFVKEPHTSDLPNLEAALKPLQDAAAMKDSKLFRPRDLIGYQNARPDLDAIVALGNCAVRAAMITRQDDPASALVYAEAAFSLGAKLFQERMTYREFQAGLDLMAGAARYIGETSKALKNDGRASVAKQFEDGRTRYVKEHVLPLIGVISSIDPSVMDEHAGDVAVFARDAKDPMWRVEAILALGRCRFAGTRSDQKRAERIVIDLAEHDSDPAVREAATAARNLMVEQFRMLK